MIRIAITPAAFKAVVSTLPLGTDGGGAQRLARRRAQEIASSGRPRRLPRKAVKTAKGRKKVIAWLKMLENLSAQQRPEDPMSAYDFTWLWRELGVSDERR